jgi:EspG family
VAGRGEEAVLVVLDGQRVAVRQISDTDLAASVVGSLPSMPYLNIPTAEVSLPGLQEIDAAMASGVSPRIVHLQMDQLGLPPALIALREQSGTAPATSGALGAVAHDADGASQHSTRSASWRELEQGALLQIERGRRHGTEMILLTPLTPDALFRAAVDAISSVYELRQE